MTELFTLHTLRYKFTRSRANVGKNEDDYDKFW